MTEDMGRLRERMMGIIDAYEDRLRVLSSLAAGVIPRGYTVVPVEPTAHMVESAEVNDGGTLARLVWKRMVGSRPMWFAEGEREA